MNADLIIYTDGACNKQGIGGYGALLIAGEDILELSGHEIDTTNNRMELMGVIVALERLKTACTIDLYTDSVYVKEGISNWINNWKKNNWKTAAKKEVLNQDLWKRLDELAKYHSVNWYWVKGHSGVEGNEICDKLATDAIKKYLQSLL